MSVDIRKRENNKREWERVVKFYQQVDGKGKYEIEIQLVRKFLNSIYVEKLYPRVSHRVLCISPTAKYDQIKDFPMITILFSGANKFRVEFWQKFWRKKETETYDVKESELWDLLDGILPKLTDNF